MMTVTSIFVAFFLFRVVFQVSFFQFINFLIIFVVMGIGADDVLDPVLEVLAQVRRAKTEAKVSQRAVAERVNVAAADATDAIRAALHAGEGDLRNAGSITNLVLVAGDDLSCEVTLEPVAS